MPMVIRPSELGTRDRTSLLSVLLKPMSRLLASELRQTTMQIQAGMGLAYAFRRLAERTGLEELRNLSAMLIQTELFGTSIGRALRIHSSSMRIKRTHRAEEKGATVAVK